MKALGMALVSVAGALAGCNTPEDLARQRCARAADVAQCVRADLAQQKAAEEKAMQERTMGNMGGMGY